MIGLLIVTHCDLGKEFVKAAEFIVGHIEAIDVVSITQTLESKEIHKMIEDKISALNKGEGVLILTDMFGGTPSNLSLSFLKDNRVEVVTGVNVPMLLTLSSYRKGRSLEEICSLVKKSGRRSIILFKEALVLERRARP